MPNPPRVPPLRLLLLTLPLALAGCLGTISGGGGGGDDDMGPDSDPADADPADADPTDADSADADPADAAPGDADPADTDPDACAPGAELCNGRDDDCDGEIDEGYGIGDPCGDGVGACAAVGALVCDGDDATRCDAAPGQPTDETCDGTDEDCDGQTDEALGGEPCETGLPGVCAAGLSACDGALVCAPTTAAADELCNALDDDCDGATDEDYAVGTPCAVGACAGLLVCDGEGATRCDFEPPDPDAETCDGTDEDCDGTVDEGACPPPAEICDNGLDDDADGLVDCDDDACFAARACNPADCDAIRVAILGGPFYHDDLRAYLDGLPDITAVRINACDAATFANHDVLVAHGNLPCFAPAAFAAHVRAGGGVVGVPWSINNGTGMDILPVEQVSDGANSIGPAALDIVAPDDPLLRGVDFAGQDGDCPDVAPPRGADPDCVGFERARDILPGATLAARHRIGGVAAAWWRQGDGVAVYLGVHYVTSDTFSAIFHPWGQRLMENAIRLAARCVAP